MALLGLLLVPVYLHYLGIEAYGLIGFFVSLQAILGVMDMGLSTTMNREMARTMISREKIQEARTLVRTMEIVYAFVGVFIALFLYSASDWMATRWLMVEQLPVETVQWAVIIFGFTVAFRWPVALYTGLLRGLEQQVLLNGLTIGVATFRGMGAVLVLVFVSPTILAFLIWQLIVGGIEVVLFGLTAWRRMPSSGPGRAIFDFSIFRTVWRFAAGVGTLSFFAMIIKQLDKILISNLLPLEQMGYYMTASAASMGLYLFVTPIFNAVFPRLAALALMNDAVLLAETYHKATQLISFTVSLAAGVLIFFSYDVLKLWTRSDLVAENAYAVLSVLAFATLLNAMMQIPFALQLASGLTWLPMWSNLIAIVVLTPVIYFLVLQFGVLGGALAWAIFNAIYYLVIPQIMHRYLLPEQKTSWIFKDTLPFLVLSFLVFGFAYFVSAYFVNAIVDCVMIFFAAVMYVAIARLFCPSLSSIFNELLKFKKHPERIVVAKL